MLERLVGPAVAGFLWFAAMIAWIFGASSIDTIVVLLSALIAMVGAIYFELIRLANRQTPTER